MANLNTLSDVIQKIIQDYGEERLLDAHFTLAVFMDLAPQLVKEKELLKIFLKCNGAQKLCAAKAESLDIQDAHINSLVKELTDNHWLSRDAARYVCGEFYKGLTNREWVFCDDIKKTPPGLDVIKSAEMDSPASSTPTAASNPNVRTYIAFAIIAVALLLLLFAPWGTSGAEGSSETVPQAHVPSDPVIATRPPVLSDPVVATKPPAPPTEPSEAVQHQHDWKEATYNEPRTCTTCGEKEGDKKVPGEKLHISDIVEDVSASSIMSGSDKYQHNPENLYDQDIRTNWTEGVSGDGLGEFVILFFDKTYAIKEFTVVTGSHYEKDSTYFEKNNRPSAITLSFSDGSDEYIVLKDTRNYQTFTLSEYHYTDYVKITIEAVYPGTKWDETIIAEVDFTAYNP